MYRSYKNRIWGSGSLHLPDLDADVIKASLCDAADYTVSATTDDAFNDIPAAAVVASATLTSVAISAGAVDAADVTFTAVSGDTSELVVIWEDTAGASSTDPLLWVYDTFASGMPVTPNGGNILLVWSASGLITL
jgi:hypothetical protein